jgi:hypothetical protein
MFEKRRARLAPPEFAVTIEALGEKAAEAPRLRTLFTEWTIDAAGALRRQLTTIEVPRSKDLR